MLVGEAYSRLGYAGGGGADGGIDLKLRNISGQTLLVQCKQWRVYKVGVKSVRELYGVMTAEGAARAIFVTTGGYTADAKEFAKGKPIELVDGDTLARLIAPIRSQASSLPSAGDILQASMPGSSTDIDAPACPVCQSGMVLRTARKAANAEAELWGCSEFP